MKHISIYKITLIAVFFSTAFASSALAQYDEKAKGILDAMSDKYQEIGSFVSDFSYSMENPTQAINEDFSGEILVQGDKYRLNMGGQEIINNGETVWTYLEEVNEVNIDNYNPAEGDISPTQIYNAYKRGFKYVYLEDLQEGQESFNVIDLLPENNDNQFFRIRLNISEEDKTLKKWQIYDKNGTIYTYKISNFNPDAEISDQAFSFDSSKYKNVEVVDLR